MTKIDVINQKTVKLADDILSSDKIKTNFYLHLCTESDFNTQFQLDSYIFAVDHFGPQYCLDDLN